MLALRGAAAAFLFQGIGSLWYHGHVVDYHVSQAIQFYFKYGREN